MASRPSWLPGRRTARPSSTTRYRQVIRRAGNRRGRCGRRARAALPPASAGSRRLSASGGRGVSPWCALRTRLCWIASASGGASSVTTTSTSLEGAACDAPVKQTAASAATARTSRLRPEMLATPVARPAPGPRARSGFTRRKIRATVPSGATTTVERSMPMYFLPSSSSRPRSRRSRRPRGRGRRAR